ncbi:MAG: zinc transporter ZupT [Flavonifractor plautii]|nr:zinc transporter ZupT [Flavonifractor plautii]MDU6289317.1 zinc transporter ZupT [Flavonifractor plautii]MDU6341859.1 zinc transporter ZupT [Flavonifractor plautii]
MLESAAVRALLLSLAAGLSTLLGALVVFAARRRSEKLLAVSLGFAGGVMLAVSFTDLFPTAREHLIASLGGRPGALAAVLSLAAGIGCAAALDHLVPHDAFDADTGEAPHKNLFRVGFVSALAMALHNFPEGVATFLAGYEDLTLGVSITLAIALHNIPEGISVAMPVWYATGSRRRAFRCTLLSGLTEPVGAVLAFALLRPFLNGLLLGVLFGAVAGIMVYIAVEELIPSSRQYGHDRPALWATLCGICVMPLTHLFQT